MNQVDYDALEKQICEKKIREQQEKELHELFARQQIRDDQIALALEKQEVEVNIFLYISYKLFSTLTFFFLVGKEKN